MKIKFLRGIRQGEEAEGDEKYFRNLIKNGLAEEVREKQMKSAPETKEEKHNPENKKRGRKRVQRND